MPPQPMSRFRSRASIVFGSSNTIAERRDLALIALECIASASELDITLGNTMVAMLGADADAAMAMYSAITSVQARNAALAAVAATAMKDSAERELFDLCFRWSKRAMEHRHRFAHCMWAYSPEHLDHILFVDQKEVHALEQRRAKIGKDNLHTPRMLDIRPNVDRANVWVYRDKDLSDAKMEIVRASIGANQLLLMLGNKSHRRAIERDWLSQWL